jgi:hypothetical protein
MTMIMNRNFDTTELLVDELQNVAKNMKTEQEISRKLYHFSAAYGICDRIMRLSYDRELLLISSILQATYNQLTTRQTAFTQGDRIVPIDGKSIDELADLVDKMAIAIQNDVRTQSILERMTELAFKTTGPGYYMQISGKIRGSSSKFSSEEKS